MARRPKEVKVQDGRGQRRHSVSKDDQRTRFERDRDRILYSSAFRRLAGITQIVRAGEADVFHTRQQHTVKVAQIGLRLAQKCRHEQPAAAEYHGLEPEVVEAACLAHDLGHPPFGHAGEHALHQLVVAADEPDGFEGNAQSFRVLTKLAVRFVECQGLDLTRATLAATLKYPWLRDPSTPDRASKWGAYRVDEDDFRFALGSLAHATKTAEAELMDWADDVAYSVHDLEDFHRCGMIPWRRILSGDRAEEVVSGAKEGWRKAPSDASGQLRDALRRLESFLTGLFPAVILETYEGSRLQRQQLRQMTSRLTGRYLDAIALVEPSMFTVGQGTVAIGPEEVTEVRILKQITKNYVISNPALAAQQKGQQKIISELFKMFLEDTGGGTYPPYLPARLRYLWDLDPRRSAPRFAADCIASLTEPEAVGLYGRLVGLSSGSVLDPIIR